MIRDEMVKQIKFAGETSGLNFLKCPRDLNDGEFFSSKNFIPEEIGGLENRKGIKYLNFDSNAKAYLSDTPMTERTIFRDTDVVYGAGSTKNLSYYYPPISNVGIDEIVDFVDDTIGTSVNLRAICSTKPLAMVGGTPNIAVENTLTTASAYPKFQELMYGGNIEFRLSALTPSGLVNLSNTFLNNVGVAKVDVKTIKLSIAGSLPTNTICFVISAHKMRSYGGVYKANAVLLYTTASVAALEFPNANCANLFTTGIAERPTSVGIQPPNSSGGAYGFNPQLYNYDMASPFKSSGLFFPNLDLSFNNKLASSTDTTTREYGVSFPVLAQFPSAGGGNYYFRAAIPREYNEIIKYITSTSQFPYFFPLSGDVASSLINFAGRRMMIFQGQLSGASITHDYYMYAYDPTLAAELPGAIAGMPGGIPDNTYFNIAFNMSFIDDGVDYLNREFDYYTAQGNSRYALFELNLETKGIFTRSFFNRSSSISRDSLGYDNVNFLQYRTTPIFFSFMPQSGLSARYDTMSMDTEEYFFVPYFVKINGKSSVVSPCFEIGRSFYYKGAKATLGQYPSQLLYPIGTTAHITNSDPLHNPMRLFVSTPEEDTVQLFNIGLQQSGRGITSLYEVSGAVRESPFLNIESFPLFKKAINYRDRVLFYDSSDSLKTIPSTVSDNRLFDNRLFGEFVQGKGDVIDSIAFARNPASASISEVQYFFYANKILAISGTWDDGNGVPVDFAINEISKEKGILCKGAVSQINGGLVFVGNDNIYFIDYNGGLLQPLGAKILPLIKDRFRKTQGSGATLIDEDKSKMYCVNYAGYLRFMIGHKLDRTNNDVYKKYELWFDGRDGMTYSWSGVHEFSFPSSGFTALPSLVKPIVTGMNICDSVSSIENTNYNLLGTYGKNLIVFDKGYKDLGNDYVSEFISPDYHFGKQGLLKAFVGCGLTVEAEGAGNVFVTMVADGGAQDSGQLSYDFQNNGIWDVSKWDEAVWQDNITEFKRIIFNERPMGRSGTFKLVSFGGHKIKLQDIELYFRIKNRSYF